MKRAQNERNGRERESGTQNLTRDNSRRAHVMTRQEEIEDFLAPQIQKQTEERIVGQTVDVFVPHVKQMIVDVAVPSIVKVISDVLVTVKKETRGEYGHSSSRAARHEGGYPALHCTAEEIVVQFQEQIVQVVKEVPQERIFEWVVEPSADNHVLQSVQEIAEVSGGHLGSSDPGPRAACGRRKSCFSGRFTCKGFLMSCF